MILAQYLLDVKDASSLEVVFSYKENHFGWIRLSAAGPMDAVVNQRRWNRKRKRARQRRRDRLGDDSPPEQTVNASKKKRDASTEKNICSSQSYSATSGLLEKMKAQLSGGHFRMINEKLYTCSGKEALNYFKEDPVLFDVYHAGYREQMSHWPEQPINIITAWLNDHNPSLVVTDFGCGEAMLAKSITNEVFSLDLISNDPSVIACDMSNTHLLLPQLISLSLMGTNYSSYIEEALRVLKPRGWLLIAEVKKRFYILTMEEQIQTSL